MVALIPSILTGAWVVGTLEGRMRNAGIVRSAVIAFYKGIFLIACPMALAAGALLPPVIRLGFSAYGPSAEIAPLMLLCFVVALLASPWGLVVRVRELAWLNALINIAQVGFAAIADLWLIRTFGLWGAFPGNMAGAACWLPRPSYCSSR
jgi:hypothetical protein